MFTLVCGAVQLKVAYSQALTVDKNECDRNMYLRC